MRPIRSRKNIFPRWIATLLLGLFLVAGIPAGSWAADGSTCEKGPRAQISGTGPLPYNYRVIDGHIHAGGHPLNPRFSNSDTAARSILHYLKSKGVKTVIDVENTRRIHGRYANLLQQEGIALLHIPMSATKVPTFSEWAQMKKAMEEPVYIHCQWGADRTGIIIAKYLVDEKGYSIPEALKAIKSGGSHAGLIGGFKPAYYGKPFQQFLSRSEP